MIEVYLFHAMFAVQILLVSALIPRRLSQLVDQSLAHNPPDPAGAQWIRRTRKGYRLANTVVVLIGLMLMWKLFAYMQRADWSDGPVESTMTAYFLLQMLPFIVVSFMTGHSSKALRNSLPGVRRKAVLQRRGLFDFVSPIVVALTLLCYPLFVAFVIFYIRRHPFEGFAGSYINIGVVTLLYCMTAIVAYWAMYGMKSNARQSHAERLRATGTIVQVLVYTCLATVVFIMTEFALALLDQQHLEPCAQGIYFVLISLWIYQSMYATPLVAASELHSGTPTDLNF